MLRANRRDGRAHTRAGGEPVIDENHRLRCELDAGTLTAISALASRQFSALSLGYGVDHIVRQTRIADYVVIQDPGAPRGDRTEGELFMSRYAELTHHEHIERNSERLRDFEAHRHSAARKREHDGALATGVRRE